MSKPTEIEFVLFDYIERYGMTPRALQYFLSKSGQSFTTPLEDLFSAIEADEAKTKPNS